MRSGNGLTYPSCWKPDLADRPNIFDVTFKDNGIVVRNIAPPNRSQDPAWSLIADFPRDAEINERLFVAATAKLAAWSKDPKQNCRFYTINHDATGPTNKPRYKQLRSTIEQNFYPYFPPSQRGPSARQNNPVRADAPQLNREAAVPVQGDQVSSFPWMR
jgi:hypothetical protein